MTGEAKKTTSSRSRIKTCHSHIRTRLTRTLQRTTVNFYASSVKNSVICHTTVLGFRTRRLSGEQSAKKTNVEKAAAVTEFAGQTSAVAEHEVNSTSSNVFHWDADTGATSHMTPHKNWIHNYRPYRVLVELANHRIIYSEGVGSVLFRLVKNGKQYRDVECTRVLHVPALCNNLLSVLYLTKYKGIDVHVKVQKSDQTRD